MEISEISEIIGIDNLKILKTPKLVWLINQGLKITNFKRIIEFDKIHLKIKLTIGFLILYGNNLILMQLNKGEVLIKGVVEKIEYVA